jgi:hypothetical protein
MPPRSPFCPSPAFNLALAKWPYFPYRIRQILPSYPLSTPF